LPINQATVHLSEEKEIRRATRENMEGVALVQSDSFPVLVQKPERCDGVRALIVHVNANQSRQLSVAQAKSSHPSVQYQKNSITEVVIGKTARKIVTILF
jgi:hypothetical protein